MISILFLLYVFCYLLHEGTCCGGQPPAPGTVGRNTYFHVRPNKIHLDLEERSLDSLHDVAMRLNPDFLMTESGREIR